MADKSYLGWPFFSNEHRKLESELDSWAHANVRDVHDKDVDAACCHLVRQLGEGGWLTHAISTRRDCSAARS